MAAPLSRLNLRTEGFSEADYLSLHGSYFVEFFESAIQFLPVLTAIHQIDYPLHHQPAFEVAGSS